jgi:hypothetical protein
MIDDMEKKVWKPDIADLAQMWNQFLDGRRISLTGKKRKIRGRIYT